MSPYDEVNHTLLIQTWMVVLLDVWYGVGYSYTDERSGFMSRRCISIFTLLCSYLQCCSVM